MSGNRGGNWGRWRPCSPYYCNTSVAALNVAEDTIRQMQAALDKEQRINNALRRERDEAQNNARIWERDLSVLRVDHRRLQASFSRLTL
jgi:hypothetical protein